jgi:hypothetical protein
VCGTRRSRGPHSAAAERHPSVGARPHDAFPCCVALPRPDPPPLSLPFPPVPRRRLAVQNTPKTPSAPPSLAPLRPPSQAPHLSPRLPVIGPPPLATGSPSIARIPAERRHRPPFPSELLHEPPILAISCNSLTPSPSQAAGPHRTRPRPSELPPHRRTPPSRNSPPASPSTCCSGAPLPSPPCSAPSLWPPQDLQQHLAAVEPPPSRWRACHRAGTRALQRAAQAVCPAGLGCQAVAQPAFRPTVHGRPPRPVGCSLGPVSARYCAGDFIVFLIVLNSKNCFKLPKFVETGRSVQKL